MGNKCTLCDKQISSDNIGYLDRGLSNKLYICGKCYEHKVKLLDCNLGEDEIQASIDYMDEHMNGKVSEVQKVVNGWIDGEYNNNFPEMNDLMYFVEGPKAYLFVFEDRVVVLESTLDYKAALADIGVKGTDVRILYHNEKENGDIVFFDDIQEKLSDLDKLKYKVAKNRQVYNSQSGYMGELSRSLFLLPPDPSLRLIIGLERFLLEDRNVVSIEKAFGEYGKLNFNYSKYGQHAEFAFEFFYHQNQLMEEIYNYILEQMSSNRTSKNTEKDKKETTPRRRRGATESKENDNASFSLADEINKLKGLMDCGLLTQEEFDEAKKKLLAKM